MLSLVVVAVLSVPSFTSADVIDVMRGKTGSGGAGREITDGKSGTCTRIFDGTSIESVRFDLGLSYKTEKFYLSATSNNGNNLRVKLLNSSGSLLKEFIRVPNGYTDANFSDVRYVVLFPDSSSFAVNVCEFTLLASDGKVTNIKNLTDKPSEKEILFKWTNPTEDDFVGIKVYKDGKILETLNKNVNSYVAKELEADKTYEFKFTSLDSKGVETKGVSKSVRTLMPVLNPPDNVFLTPQSGKMVIAWNDVNSSYLKGYNVYIDGKKINDKPLTSSKMIVKNLENNKSYKVQISAVNKNDVEGEKSKEKSDKPSSNALEVEYDVKIPFSPMDFLKTSLFFLGLIGPFVLLALAITYHKRLAGMIKKSLISYRERRKQ